MSNLLALIGSAPGGLAVFGAGLLLGKIIAEDSPDILVGHHMVTLADLVILLDPILGYLFPAEVPPAVVADAEHGQPEVADAGEILHDILVVILPELIVGALQAVGPHIQQAAHDGACIPVGIAAHDGLPGNDPTEVALQTVLIAVPAAVIGKPCIYHGVPPTTVEAILVPGDGDVGHLRERRRQHRVDDVVVHVLGDADLDVELHLGVVAVGDDVLRVGLRGVPLPHLDGLKAVELPGPLHDDLTELGMVERGNDVAGELSPDEFNCLGNAESVILDDHY